MTGKAGARGRRRHEPTVFVVDDERDVCRSIVMLLRSAGLRGRPFVDPLAFLAAIRPEVLAAGSLPSATG